MAVFTTAAAAVGVAGAVGSYQQGKKAASKSKKAMKLQKKITAIENMQAKRQFLRDFRQKQAAAIMGGIGAGVDIESSMVQGTLQSQETQRRVALNEFAQLEALGSKVSTATMQAGNAASRSELYGAVGQFARSAPVSNFARSLDKKFNT